VHAGFEVVNDLRLWLCSAPRLDWFLSRFSFLVLQFALFLVHISERGAEPSFIVSGDPCLAFWGNTLIFFTAGPWPSAHRMWRRCVACGRTSPGALYFGALATDVHRMNPHRDGGCGNFSSVTQSIDFPIGITGSAPLFELRQDREERCTN
jgi:hypothetical protein